MWPVWRWDLPTSKTVFNHLYIYMLSQEQSFSSYSLVFLQIQSPSFMPLVMCPSQECVTNKSGGRLYLQTRGSKFIKFQELRIQEHVRNSQTCYVCIQLFWLTLAHKFSVITEWPSTCWKHPKEHDGVRAWRKRTSCPARRPRSHHRNLPPSAAHRLQSGCSGIICLSKYTWATAIISSPERNWNVLWFCSFQGLLSETYLECHSITLMNKTEDDELGNEELTDEELRSITGLFVGHHYNRNT